MPNPVIIYDASWKINRINQTALALLGYSEVGELLGMPVQHILSNRSAFPGEDLPSRLNSDSSLSAGPGIEMEHLSKDGKCLRFLAQFKKVADDENPGHFFYYESGFCLDELLQEVASEQQKRLDYWNLLADNVPGLTVVLVNKDLDMECSFGQKNADFFRASQDCGNKSFMGLLPPEFKAVLQPLFKIAREGTSVSREFSYRDDFFTITLDPLMDENGQFLCVVVVQNITETKLVEKKLMLSKEEAEDANEAKSDFVAKMSHEIRTPLNAIIGFSDQLKRTRLTNKQSDYLDIVNNSSQHLLSIVEDILVLSKVESGQIQVEPEPFKVGIVLKTVHDILGHRILKKDLAFKRQSDIPEDEVLLGDVAKLRQILINLMSNSIKFTHQGRIVLSCSTIHNTAKRRTIRFDVSDSGIGISRKELKFIFEPFHQIDNSLSRSYFGSGLGLTICKELVRSLGGEISVSSTLKKGSTFSFTLSFEKSQKPYMEHRSLSSKVHKDFFKNLNILFVDDDPINRMLGEIILKKYKAKVVFAKTGQEAIRRYKPGNFQIVLLDINMPELNGIEVAKQLREMEGHSKCRQPATIIAMTANALQRHIKKYIQSGMDDFILKPFTEENLYQKIALHASGTKDDGNHDFYDEAGSSATEGEDLEGLLKFTKGDKDFTLLMLTTFMDNSSNLLRQIKFDFERNDYPSIGESAHRLLPSMEQLGFHNTNKLLKSIERRYLRKESFKKDPQLVEKAIGEIAKCIASVKESMEAIK
ncbi:ATP-binding protein [Geofilum rubicundum]|nr:ATP-binding protein [Geofilum rubicundum]